MSQPTNTADGYRQLLSQLMKDEKAHAQFLALNEKSGGYVNFDDEFEHFCEQLRLYRYQKEKYNKTLGYLDYPKLKKYFLKAAREGLTFEKELGMLSFTEPSKGGVITGYKGEMIKMMRYPFIKRIDVELVKEHDEFQYNGPSRAPHHVSTSLDNEKRGQCHGGYCLVHYKDGSVATLVMTKQDLDKVLSESCGTNRVWNEWQDEMLKKTVVHRAYKWLESQVKFGGRDHVSTMANNVHQALDVDREEHFTHGDTDDEQLS